MARSDRSRFLRQMIDSEAEMDALFQTLAEDIGNLVLRAQDADGTVPISKLAGLQKRAGRLVDEVFLNERGRPFSDEDNEPLAPFPRIIAEGQRAMIELALERAATILDKHLPEDLRLKLGTREVVGGS